MRQDVHDALASQFDSHRIVRQLHDVPPHEVYEVKIDGRRAIYKGNTGPTGNAEIEGRVIAFVDRETSVPVPEIIAVGDGYFVAAWHPDAPAPDVERDTSETWAEAAGRGLATLHEETAPAIGEYGQFKVAADGALTIDGHDEWRAAAVAYVEHHRPVLAEHGHADVADAVIDFLRENPDCLAGAGDPVCCHGWATPEHVAVEDGAVACVIDFEHAIAAPGEFDYWRTVLPTFGPDGDESQRSFREGYESVRPFPSGFDRRKPIYVLLNEVYYLESLYVQAQHGPDATADQAQWFRDRVFDALDRLT